MIKKKEQHLNLSNLFFKQTSIQNCLLLFLKETIYAYQVCIYLNQKYNKINNYKCLYCQFLE